MNIQLPKEIRKYLKIYKKSVINSYCISGEYKLQYYKYNCFY